MSQALLEVLKHIAVDSVESGRPMKLLFGTVISEAPLSIEVEQHKILTEEFLILCREVTEYSFDMTVDHVTEQPDQPMTAKIAGGGGDPSFSAHQHKHEHIHPYKGRKTFLVHNNLLVGEKVAMIQMQGGQKYLVIDRVKDGTKQQSGQK